MLPKSWPLPRMTGCGTSSRPVEMVDAVNIVEHDCASLFNVMSSYTAPQERRSSVSSWRNLSMSLPVRKGLRPKLGNKVSSYVFFFVFSLLLGAS